MIEAGGACTEDVRRHESVHAPPGGGHGLTTDDPTQGSEGAKRSESEARAKGRAERMGNIMARPTIRALYTPRPRRTPAHERSRWSRARREAARSQGVVPVPPGVAGCYSSSTKVISTLAL